MIRGHFAALRPAWALSARILTVILAASAGVCAQSTRTVVARAENDGLINFDNLPIDTQMRKMLTDSVESANYTRAEELLVSEVSRQPHSYALLATLGGLFFLDGKYLNCAVALKKAQRTAPLREADHYTLALTYVVLKKPAWARAEFEQLASSHPRNPAYPYWQGRIDYDLMHFKSAIAEFSRALAMDNNFMKAYENLGLTFEAMGDFDSAIKSYQRATRLNRQQRLPSPWPPLNFGALLIKLGRFAEAEDELREALRYDARFPRAHYELGRLLQKENKDWEALQQLRQAVRYDPPYPEPHYAMGQIYQRAGEKKQAEIEWRTFQELKRSERH